MEIIIAGIIICLFTLGTSIFYVLRCVEQSVLGLVFNKKKRSVTEEDIRFTHASLKRLSPLLPPSNGVVILLGNAAMVYQGFLLRWEFLSILILVLYWIIMIYVIFVKKIAADVRNLQETPNDSSLDKVKSNVSNLIKQHHLGLAANLSVVIIEFIILRSFLI